MIALTEVSPAAVVFGSRQKRAHGRVLATALTQKTPPAIDTVDQGISRAPAGVLMGIADKPPSHAPSMVKFLSGCVPFAASAGVITLMHHAVRVRQDKE